MADWRDKAKQRMREKAEGATLTLTEGNNCIRVLPDKKDLTPEGKVSPKGIQHPPNREFRTHRNVGPDRRMSPCGKSIEEEGSCWLCDVKIPELKASKNPAKRTLADEMHAQEQYIVNATRFDPETQKFGKPKVWWISTGSGIPGKQGQSLAYRVGSRLAGLTQSKKDFVDPIRGYNLNITRTGQALKTRYSEIESDESPTKVPSSVLSMVQSLDDVVPVYDEEDQKALYFGRESSDRDERPAAGKKRKAAPVEDDEDAEDVVDATDEDEDLEAEEDEDLDAETADEEEEVEAAPPKKTSGKASAKAAGKTGKASRVVDEEPEEVVDEDEIIEDDIDEEVDEEDVAEDLDEEVDEEPPPPPKKTAGKKAAPPKKVRK